MRENPSSIVDSLLTDGKLDGLLAEARKMAAPVEATPAALDAATASATAARDACTNAVADEERARNEKVATVRAMLLIGSRLIPE